ncbi:MAG: phosphatase PAP2 family protein [Cyanobacteriota bacterium]|nr:phosphatase PAP2 family protein [Cyanobacteriota bacterium]
MKTYLSIGVAVASMLVTLPAKAAVEANPGGTSNIDNAVNSVIEWNKITLQAVQNTLFAPPMTARALAILQTSIFDAWSAYDPVATSTQSGDSYQRPTDENTLSNKNTAISYAAYTSLVNLFPTQTTLFDSLMSSLGYSTADKSTDTTTAVGIGNMSAQAVLSYRQNDGANQSGSLNASGKPYSEPTLNPNYTPYTPVNTADQLNSVNHWQPEGTQQFLAPHWGSVTPFGLASGSQFLPTQGPKTIENDPEGFKAQAQQVLDFSENLTDEQILIADYWAAGGGTVTPPGMWNQIAQEISIRDNHSLDDDVKMFFALDNAVFDAGIASWDAKRTFDSERPITAINYLFEDDPEFQAKYPNGWKPLLATPPFPEFVSGHSTYSAAAAEILTQFTGSDYYGGSYTDPTTGITLSWNTFSDAAAEAGMSRLYGGIHFMDANLVGQDMGRTVAGVVWDKALSFISPSSDSGASGSTPSTTCGAH